MMGAVRTTTVAGKTYKVWSDFSARGTFARNEEGEVRQLCGSGYIHHDLTVRKAIANVFQTGTFRK